MFSQVHCLTKLSIFLQELTTPRLDKLHFLWQKKNVFCNSLNLYYENIVQESLEFQRTWMFLDLAQNELMHSFHLQYYSASGGFG